MAKMTREEKKEAARQEAIAAQQARAGETARREHESLIRLRCVEDERRLDGAEDRMVWQLDYHVRRALDSRDEAARQWKLLAERVARTASEVAAGRLQPWNGTARSEDAETALAAARALHEQTTGLLGAFGWYSKRLGSETAHSVNAHRRLSVVGSLVQQDGVAVLSCDSAAAAWVALQARANEMATEAYRAEQAQQQEA